MRAPPPEHDTPIELFTVHGTFAKRAKWVEPHSEFMAYLRECLPVVSVTPFRWSGANTFRARIRAADAFCELLEGRVSERPNYRRFAICHSHGGNVARRAAALGLVDGLITLSTPFFGVRRRKSRVLPQPLFEDLAAMLGVVVVLVVLFLGSWLVAWVGAGIGLGGWFWTVASVLQSVRERWGDVGILAALIFPVVALFVWLGDRNAQLVGRLTEEYESRLGTPIPTLAISTPADEAAGVLAASRFLSWLLDTPGRRLRKLHSDSPSLAVALGIGLGMLVLAIGYEWTVDGLATVVWAIGGAPTPSTLLYVAAGATAFVAGTVAMLTVAAHGMVAGIMGWDAMSMAPYLEFYVDPAPRGPAATYVTAHRGGLGLSHSSAYEDPEVWLAVERWVRDDPAANDHVLTRLRRPALDGPGEVASGSMEVEGLGVSASTRISAKFEIPDEVQKGEFAAFVVMADHSGIPLQRLSIAREDGGDVAVAGVVPTKIAEGMIGIVLFDPGGVGRLLLHERAESDDAQ